jgi:hypothetical protein
MRDHESTQEALDKHGFDEWHDVEDLPERTVLESKFRSATPRDFPDRYDPGPEFYDPELQRSDAKPIVPTSEALFYHATLLKHVPSILEDGILPRCESLQAVWYPKNEKKGYDVLRECHTYLWNERYAGLQQAVATVETVGEGNMALLLIDMNGKMLENDPENQGGLFDLINEVDNTDPVSVMHPAGIEKERIRCVCYLKEELLPDVGSTINFAIQGTDILEWSSELSDRDRWECRCRK